MLITMRRLASLAAETERLKDLNDLSDQWLYAKHVPPQKRAMAYYCYFEALERWRLAYMDQPKEKSCGSL